MTALDLSHNMPENVRLAISLAGHVEAANAGELAPASMEEAIEFIGILASGLVHLSHYAKNLSDAVLDENGTNPE